MELKMLVLEDNLALKPLWDSIARRNFGPGTLDWAVSAEEGKKLLLESVRQGRPYAVLATDVFLAGSETGLDFARFVRACGQTTPILLMSVLEEGSLKQSLDPSLEPIVVLGKPLNVLKCERVLEHLASGRSLWPRIG